MLTAEELAGYFALGVIGGLLAWSVGYVYSAYKRVLSVAVGD